MLALLDCREGRRFGKGVDRLGAWGGEGEIFKTQRIPMGYQPLDFVFPGDYLVVQMLMNSSALCLLVF